MPIEPNPFDDAKLAEIRAGQEDPIVQYFIVRKDIPMSVGKIGAQIAHGAEMFVFRYKELSSLTRQLLKQNLADENERVELTERWVNQSFRKVVLGGKLKDFEKIKSELLVFVVKDAGLTEVEPNTETVIATWPMLRSKCPKVLSRLQVLK
jgi:PTH2 family peptidyl-tRNA hydrolase